jgi:NAD(P)-dependent dehydrogenase (short-subunit alcohol dehydrogenase family)
MGKVIVVTGAGRGIGAATAKLAAERGYSVGVNFVRDREAAGRVVDACRQVGTSAVAVQADVSVEADVVRLFETVDRDLGRVTALRNNAGVLERQMRVEEMDARRIARGFAVNVTGSFLCCREAVRRMSTKRGEAGGAIVNVSSVAGRRGSSSRSTRGRMPRTPSRRPPGGGGICRGRTARRRRWRRPAGRG